MTGCLLAVLAVGAPAGGAGPGDGDRAGTLPAFNRDVRPILADRCFPCHGPDAAARRAGLRLDVRDAAVSARRGRPAIVPGRPAASELVQRVFADDPGVRMPPPESKLALGDGERAVLHAWIEAGAVYEPHWSFVPVPDRVDPPAVRDASWVRDPIDAFVLARLEAAGMSPSREAERSRWLRRVSYDLTGLPPAPGQIDAFLADDAPGAHERVVDRLLASPRYGERLAVPWLDLARYADSYGYQSDQLSPTWPWRDWVIAALNANMPYDEFLTRQLAGDMLPEATRDDHVATAFNRLHRMTNEGGSIPEEWRAEYAADRVSTFGTAMLGLTLECARCHDHKYDPISQREYYQLTAYFNSIDEHGLYERSDIVPAPSVLLPTPRQEAEIDAARASVREAGAALAAARREGRTGFAAWLEGDPDPAIPDVVGHHPLDAIGPEGALANVREDGAGAGRTHPGTSTRPPVVVEGVREGGLRVDGDNLAHLPGVGDLDRWTPFTIAMWLRVDTVEETPRVVAHRSSGTDAGPYGVDLLLEGERLVARVFRHWPGNAIAVSTRAAAVAPGAWTHVVWRYDGSCRAAGIDLHVDGRPAEVRVVRDRLWKPVGGGSTYGPGGRDLVLGQRFRDAGLSGGTFDEVVIVRRAVSDLEARHLFDGRALNDALADPGGREAELLEYYLGAFDGPTRAATDGLRARREELARREEPVAEIMTMAELDEPRPTWCLERGAYDAPKTPESRVARGVPAVIGRGAVPADRRALARWLTDPAHPLTARVAVNRLWQTCFGRGLVETSENLGLQGRLPTHPELLDHLARAFVDGGWDVKAMLRRIVLSATYRQDSVATAAQLAVDPANERLARGPRRRLSAEMLRDTALSASGLLVPTLGGPPVSPYQPEGLWRAFNSMSPAYRQGEGESLYRRSLYTVWKRTAPMPSMVTFDAPGREACVARRSQTSTPLQALVLLNDVQFVEAARVLAQRSMLQHADPDARLRSMFSRLGGRAPRPRELAILRGLLEEQRAIYAADGEAAGALLAVGASAADERLDAVELASYTIVAQSILNADVTVWQR
ncbi:MAG: DUF1553 domain-containing protein [Planctomycetota bacterium]